MHSIDIFPWDDNFNTDIAVIDEQHKKLVQLLNKLASHVAFQSDLPALNIIFDELTDYALYHFQTEEAIWHEYLGEDPMDAAHKAVHNSFIDEVVKLKAQEHTMPVEDVVEKVLAFLTRWLASHILENDRYLAKLVFAIQSGLDLAPAKQQATVQMGGSTKVLIEIILSIYENLSTNTLHLMRELGQRKLVEADLRIAATAFESHMGMIIANADQTILRVNRAFTEITGYSEQDAVGKKSSLLSSGRHDAAFYVAMWSSIALSGSWQGEIWNRRKNGDVFPEWLTISTVKDEAGLTTHYVASFSDISAHKSAEAQVKHLAFYDPLTQLPNRRLLMDRLEQALVSGVRHQRKGALLFVDLDDFKTINDTLGHYQGDLLLEQVAHRLLNCVREGDTVARLGGDEFVVMLEDLSEDAFEAATQAKTVGEKIRLSLNQIYQLGLHKHHSTPSIGVTLFGNVAHESIEEPLKRADLAMYQAKAAGRNTLRFFDPQMQAVVMARATLEAGLREALAKAQFCLYYQAQVAGDNQLTGVEALVRWQHPQRGMVSPAEFIPLAEETGLILPLGLWVLETACAQLACWATQPEMAHLTVAVNVSAHQFHQDSFVDQVLAVLARTGANPQRLKLELTESLLVAHVEDVIAKMNTLKAQGVGFSLDDFGTGYSSLSYLKRLPLDQLKIDQGFVRDILIDPNDAAIAKMVIVLADSLGLAVIAEGVETGAQRDFLAAQGCHSYQGYLFSRPLPLTEFEMFARQNRSQLGRSSKLSEQVLL
jgi:diguanylate cyclase (GGDEF)-like protein/hemerythrin-like metal-binding protein/PAS domain S-box-containing protein